MGRMDLTEKQQAVFDFLKDYPRVRYTLEGEQREQRETLGGLRRSFFLGKFTFIDGNEEFEVTSKHWGLGLGVDSYFRVSRNIDLVVTTALDYFFPSTLSGHDTSYSPDNNNVNPEGGYRYQDADKAINQPKLEPRLMLGFSYRF